jgi:hypothetical protein
LRLSSSITMAFFGRRAVDSRALIRRILAEAIACLKSVETSVPARRL